MKKSALLPILIFSAVCLLSACRHEPPKREPKTEHIIYQTVFHTIDATREKIKGVEGIVVYNDALEFDFDSTEIEDFKEKGFQFHPVTSLKKGEQTLWLKKDNIFTQSAVRCIQADEDRTIITQGVKEGDEVVLGMDQIPVHQ